MNLPEGFHGEDVLHQKIILSGAVAPKAISHSG
jgi:hypothetical protein